MKLSEIRGTTLEDLKSRLSVEQDAYQKMKFSHSVTPLENPIRLKYNRRLVAKIKTVIQEKSKQQS